MDKNKEFWNQMDDYLRYPSEAVVRFLAANKPAKNEKKLLLDWGCANGRHLQVAKDFGYDLIGFDYNQKLLEIAKSKLKNATLIYNENPLDLEQIADESVDVLLCFGVVFWNCVQNQNIMLKNIARMLKKDGVAFVDFRSERDSHAKAHYSELEVISQSLAEIKQNLKSAGLEVLNTEIYEFSQNNMSELCSWYQLTLGKAK